MKWKKANEGLPEDGKKVFVKWQGFYDEHGGCLDREEIEEKMRDESIVGVQWLDETPSEEPDQDQLWDEAINIICENLSEELPSPSSIEDCKKRFIISRK